MQLKGHSSGWTDERCDILLWLTMNSEWRAGQAHPGMDIDLFISVMLPHSPYNPSTEPSSCLSHSLFYLFLRWWSLANRRVSHHPSHSKSSLDSLKGHKGMDGLFFPLVVSMVIFFLLILSLLCLWWSKKIFLYLQYVSERVDHSLLSKTR